MWDFPVKREDKAGRKRTGENRREGRRGERGDRTRVWGGRWVLIGLDEFAEVLVPLESGPCAAPTVRRLERVEVRARHLGSMLRGSLTRDQPERDTGDEGRPFPCVRIYRRFRALRSSEESQLSRVVAWALG